MLGRVEGSADLCGGWGEEAVVAAVELAIDRRRERRGRGGPQGRRDGGRAIIVWFIIGFVVFFLPDDIVWSTHALVRCVRVAPNDVVS